MTSLPLLYCLRLSCISLTFCVYRLRTIEFLPACHYIIISYLAGHLYFGIVLLVLSDFFFYLISCSFSFCHVHISFFYLIFLCLFERTLGVIGIIFLSSNGDLSVNIQQSLGVQQENIFRPNFIYATWMSNFYVLLNTSSNS